VAFNPNGQLIASGSDDRTVKVWSARNGELVTNLPIDFNYGIRNVVFSPDGKLLAGTDYTKRIRVWDMASAKLVPDGPAPEWFNPSIASSRSPDGQWFAISHSDGTILLIKPLPPDEFELGYREAMARPDPDWHWLQVQKYEKKQSWFAAAFHCEQVLESRPDDAAAKKLLEKAKQEWEKQKAAAAGEKKP
jgi:hypothetical protein